MGAGTVRVFDNEGVHVRDIGKGQLHGPAFVVLHGQNIYVSDQHKNAVSIFDKEGNFVKNISKKCENGEGSTQLCRPQGIALDGDGNIFVSNSGQFSGIISVFDKHGTCLRNMGHLKPFEPRGLAVCSSGNIYAACASSNHVVVMDKNGKHVSTLCVPTPSQFCVDSQGPKNGKHVSTLCVPTPSQFCVDSQGLICVGMYETRHRRYAIRIL
jgi:DNA-binding beta-propeller fold protein YncE